MKDIDSKVIEFPVKKICATCLDFERCFRESTIILRGIPTIGDKEFSKNLIACKDYKGE